MKKSPHVAQFGPLVTQLNQALGASWAVSPISTGQSFPCGVGLTPAWFATNPPSGVRPQAACCVSSMRRSSSALGVFWARSFHRRPYPSFSIRRDRGQERTH